MFWGPKRYKLLDRDDEEWQLDCWSWLIENLGGLAALDEQPLIVPTVEFFRRPKSGDNPAEHYFAEVIRLTGMQHWPFRLVEQETDVDAKLAPLAMVRNAPHGPLGTFHPQPDNEILISYSPELLDRPEDLVATFAHEISHGVVRSIGKAPPGGWENEEFTTDLTVAFLGFGVFGANSAFRFSQFSDTATGTQGWSFQRAGYLSQLEWSFAIAVFLSLKGDEPDQALRFLNPGPAASLKKCLKYLHKFPECLETIQEQVTAGSNS
jgi:hypothetical protein